MINEENSLCSHCETGRQAYELDSHSAVCPFLNCYRKGKCTMFTEADKHSENIFSDGSANRQA